MAISINTVKRVFKLNKNKEEIVLPDVNVEMTIEEVADFYSSKYPELMNSSYEKSEVDGDLVITFKSIAGTKG